MVKISSGVVKMIVDIIENPPTKEARKCDWCGGIGEYASGSPYKIYKCDKCGGTGKVCDSNDKELVRSIYMVFKDSGLIV